MRPSGSSPSQRPRRRSLPGPPAPSLDQEDSDSQHNGRRRGEGRDPAGQRNDPARGRSDGGNGGSGGLLKRVAQPIPDPLQVVLFAGGLGRAVQPAESALREDQLLQLEQEGRVAEQALQAFSRQRSEAACEHSVAPVPEDVGQREIIRMLAMHGFQLGHERGEVRIDEMALQPAGQQCRVVGDFQRDEFHPSAPSTQVLSCAWSFANQVNPNWATTCS